MTTAGSASRPMLSSPLDASWSWPRKTPPMAASTLPMAQASRFMRLTLMPETTAASWLLAVARISKPADVNLKNAPKPAMQHQLTMAATRCSCDTRTPPMMKLPVGNGVVSVCPWGP